LVHNPLLNYGSKLQCEYSGQNSDIGLAKHEELFMGNSCV